MSDHEELVAEMASVEKMPIAERLKLAKKRRALQLKNFAQFEKQGQKTPRDNRDRDRKSKQSTAAPRKKINQLRFADSILLLDAAAKNDLDEGNLQSCVSTVKLSFAAR